MDLSYSLLLFSSILLWLVVVILFARTPEAVTIGSKPLTNRWAAATVGAIALPTAGIILAVLGWILGAVAPYIVLVGKFLYLPVMAALSL